MESIYLGIVLFLFLLAIFDLVVGVSNDAVNFLGSAVGARAASFKWIMGVAAVGILCGAVMSNGMMDVARHGIFRPEQFYFQDIMCICLAVMAIDVILLDTFNTLGLPTSTTVSIVFELLGGAFALAMVKLAADDTGLTFADMLNSEKALSVIMAIFLSVAIAFVFGAVVQYIARLIFTFNYKSHMKWSAALFGGVAMTAIIYFILIKGMKDSSFMTPELSEWISTYTRHLVAGCFIFFCLLSQVLHWCRINIFKVVTLLGTFALALAFAGNDLVNFVGVPLTGYSSYMDYVANGNGSETFLMDSLNAPARTPFIFLALSGVVMIVALTTSRKARGVIKTSVDLARQDAGDEMFGSSGLARSIVRASSSLATGIDNAMPQGLKRWLGKRFDKDEAILENGAAFDMVRAAVNLLLKMDRYLDLVIPRGGERLIRLVCAEATMPVLKHYKGVCHLFVDRECDIDQAVKIIVNAKCQRPGVCNALETLLIHRDIAPRFVPPFLAAMRENGVELRGDAEFCKLAPEALPATEEDYFAEYLALILAVRTVGSVEEAVEHINRYGTKHTECIITADEGSAEYFLKNVDAAVVDWNASTRFTDGFECGFGAELGISTQKRHARGPLGLEEITSYKYLVLGTGQARP